jgi:MSHA biogenesis protein MshJ
MKAWLNLQARRINAMTLRERAMMFVSFAAALVALADVLVLSPRVAEQKALGAQLRGQAAELQALRGRVAGTDAPETPAQKLQRELQQLRARQQAVDAELTRQLAAAAAGARLPELLERVLRRHDRLTLLRLATAPVTPGKPGQLPTQAVDLVLRGQYLDLTQYVADAERALPGLRWGDLSLRAEDGASELSARVLLMGDPR